MSSSTEYAAFESYFLIQGLAVMVVVLIVGTILLELWRISRRQRKNGNSRTLRDAAE